MGRSSSGLNCKALLVRGIGATLLLLVAASGLLFACFHGVRNFVGRSRSSEIAEVEVEVIDLSSRPPKSLSSSLSGDQHEHHVDSAGGVSAGNGKIPWPSISCMTVPAPPLGSVDKAPWPLASRKVRICYPNVSSFLHETGNADSEEQQQGEKKFPLHLFSHGDLGGGSLFSPVYGRLQAQIAGYGFVAVAYLSCWFDHWCANGEASFFEGLRALGFVEQQFLDKNTNPNKLVERTTSSSSNTITSRLQQIQKIPVDLSLPYSVSGHSTGGRVSLMLAAMQGSVRYREKVLEKLSLTLTENDLEILSKFRAFVGIHPDPLADPQQDPDIPDFDIPDPIPVFVATGSGDWIEAANSTWKDFSMASSKEKVFVNFGGDAHMEPAFSSAPHEIPFVGAFLRFWVLGDRSDVVGWGKIYGVGGESLVKSKLVAPRGSLNNGGKDAELGVVVCSKTLMKNSTASGSRSYGSWFNFNACLTGPREGTKFEDSISEDVGVDGAAPSIYY